MSVWIFSSVHTSDAITLTLVATRTMSPIHRISIIYIASAYKYLGTGIYA